MLECRQLNVTIGKRTLVSGLDLTVRPGKVVAILGVNGAGKTSTLMALAGLRPATGEILLDGQSIHTWSRRAIARRVGLMLQADSDPFPVTVIDAALSGRYPHLGLWQGESEDDRERARIALRATGLSGLEERLAGTLSGGERRRLAVATLLTQAPGVFLLDEPVSHLDPRHQVQILDLFRERANAGHAVLLSLHDVNLAARYADEVLFLNSDRSWTAGPVSELLNARNLTNLYQTPIRAYDAGGRPFFVSA